MMQSHVQVPHGLQGKMRGPSPLCPACSIGLGKDKTCYWFCWDVLACVCPAMCHPWPEPLLLSVPMPLMVCAGVVQDAGMAWWDRLCLSSGVQRALLSTRAQLGCC